MPLAGAIDNHEHCLVIDVAEFEEGLGMCTDRADFRSFDSLYDEATVAADPGLLVVFLEDFLFFDVSQESEVAFFVVFFDFSDFFK